MTTGGSQTDWEKARNGKSETCRASEWPSHCTGESTILLTLFLEGAEVISADGFYLSIGLPLEFHLIVVVLE